MSNKNKNKQTDVAKTEVAQNEVEQTNEGSTLDLTGLEESPKEDEGLISKHVVNENTPKFDDIDWLQSNSPMDYINDTTKSSKYDEERELKIQDGLKLLSTISVAGVSINPLLVLLGHWWEVKPARTAIKNMIDVEAEKKGYNNSVYMQNQLGKQVDIFTEFQTAIDRIRYAKTYYKPRKDIKSQIITKPLQIDGKIYLVPVIELEQAKIDYEGRRDELVTYLLSISVEQADTTIEEL